MVFEPRRGDLTKPRPKVRRSRWRTESLGQRPPPSTPSPERATYPIPQPTFTTEARRPRIHADCHGSLRIIRDHRCPSTRCSFSLVTRPRFLGSDGPHRGPQIGHMSLITAFETGGRSAPQATRGDGRAAGLPSDSEGPARSRRGVVTRFRMGRWLPGGGGYMTLPNPWWEAA